MDGGDCSQLEDTRDFVRGFYRRAGERRVPLSGSMDLTRRCNLRCVQCYQGPASRAETAVELATAQVLGILDELAAAGCLYLLFTGGEPLLRPDFAEIYRHARRLGMVPSVFTNGTLVKSSTVELFREYPPRAVEISVYGATAATYERMTRVPGSFDRCMDGIRLLRDGGVEIRLKTVLTTMNRCEFSRIEELARAMGVKFRMDAMIIPRLNGDRDPVRLRVPPEEAARLEFSDPVRGEQWRKCYRDSRAWPETDRVFRCGAGRTSFHVDAEGRLTPCALSKAIRYDLLGGSFERGWREEIPRIWEWQVSADSACGGCDLRVLCGLCPAYAELETGHMDRGSDFFCALGQERRERIEGEACDDSTARPTRERAAPAGV